MMERRKHFRLDDEYQLIVETSPTYQPDLDAEAHFAGIWPEDGGPAAKRWFQAESPAEAFRMAQKWAEEELPRVRHGRTGLTGAGEDEG